MHLERDFVVVLKPVGVLSQAGAGDNMPALLQAQLGGEIYPIHRLDRAVSGVMVYARNQKTAGTLSKAVQEGRMKKEYLAVVSGRPEQQGVLEDLLLHDRQKNKSYVVKRMRGGVKKAKLSYCVLAEAAGHSLVQVRLYTGRTHQIRVQFASRGMPLMGDGRYGGGSGEIALASVRLSFPHPRDGAMCVYSHLPDSLGAFTALPELIDMD